MSRLYLRKGEVGSNYAVSSWQSVMFSEFEAQMSSEARPFPCVFGVAGLSCRTSYAICFSIPSTSRCSASSSRSLSLNPARYGPNTSLVRVYPAAAGADARAYYRKMWLTLDQLARLDKSPWPDTIPEQIDHPMWEFSFAGEPIFVVCSTPAHVMRQSRRSSAFMLTFQPRWVFEKILGTEKAAAAAFAEVRKRLIPYDSTSPSPLLGRYGASDGREYQQYFLPDDNHARNGMSVRQARAEQDPSNRRQGASGMTRIIAGTKTEFSIDPAILDVASGAGQRRAAARRRGQGASFPHPPRGRNPGDHQRRAEFHVGRRRADLPRRRHHPLARRHASPIRGAG